MENPSSAAELSFQPDVADRLRAEFPEASDKIESQASLESPIIVYVADNSKAGTSRTLVQMEETAVFWSPIGVQANTPVALVHHFGIQSTDTLRSVSSPRISNRW